MAMRMVDPCLGENIIVSDPSLMSGQPLTVTVGWWYVAVCRHDGFCEAELTVGAIWEDLSKRALCSTLFHPMLRWLLVMV
jgi:hypothetical protein